MWPRYNVIYDEENVFYLDNDVVPEKLKQAVTEAAVYFSNNDSLFPDTDNPGALKRERIKIDVLEFEEEYLGSNSASEISSTIDSLLVAYVEGKGGGRGINMEVSRG